MLTSDDPTRAYIVDPKTEVITRLPELETLICRTSGLAQVGENQDLIAVGYCPQNIVKKIVRKFGGQYPTAIRS